MMDGRYEVFATHGKGVFSTVLRARDKGQTDALGCHPEVPPKQICMTTHSLLVFILFNFANFVCSLASGSPIPCQVLPKGTSCC